MALVRKYLGDVASFLWRDGLYHLTPGSMEGWAYPVDLDFTLAEEARYYHPMDGRGLPMRRYRSVGVQYNPTRIAAFGLAHYNRFLRTGEEPHRDLFFRAADWFAGVEGARFAYAFAWNDLEPGWISCMAQGEGMSVLTRAFQLTEDPRYLAAAKAAIEPLRVPVQHGGVRSELPGGGAFLEEYPSSDAVHVLNGFLYALIGVSDLERLWPEASERAGLAELVATIEHRIGAWDLGYWSAYDLAEATGACRNAATVDYHRLHVTQLRYLGRVLSSPVLASSADRWERSLDRFGSRARALGSKVCHRLRHRTQR